MVPFIYKVEDGPIPKFAISCKVEDFSIYTSIPKVVIYICTKVEDGSVSIVPLKDREQNT